LVKQKALSFHVRYRQEKDQTLVSLLLGVDVFGAARARVDRRIVTIYEYVG